MSGEVLRSERRGAARVLTIDREAACELWLSEDHREAEAAFEEKRRPSFRGR